MGSSSSGSTRRRKPPPAEVVDISVQGDYTLRDVADLVLDQGYTEDYAERKTGFARWRIDSYLAHQRRLRANSG